jgi:ABC-2 type transport system permease protein
VNIRGIMKKELLSGIRSYRFLAVFAGLLFFAVMNPVMTKLVLPEIFRSVYPEMSQEMLNTMFSTTQTGSIQAYLGDIFEIGTLIIAFLFSGIVAQEISEKTLILPVCTGKKYGELMTVKLIANGFILMLATTVAAMINYYYSGVMFGFEMVSSLPVLRAGLLQGLYMVFVLAMLMLIGSLVKKHVLTGLLVLIPAYGMGFIGELFNINDYLPSGLLVEGQMLSLIPSAGMLISVICTLCILVLMIAFTVIRLGKMELAKG